MQPNTRLNRHAQLWEAGTASVRQTAVAVLIFAAVMLFNITPTYVENEQSSPGDLEKVNKQLDALAQEEKDIADEQARMTMFHKDLESISKTLTDRPWNVHISDLRNQFLKGPIADPKMAADNAIHAVADQIRNEVVIPFKSAVQAYGMISDFGDAEQIELVVNNWEKDTLPSNWYYTVDLKIAAATRIKEGLEDELKETFANVDEALRNIAAELEEKQAQRASRTKVIEKEKSDRLEEKQKIEQALQAALPGWAQNLVNVDSMVKFYPWVLMAATIYLLGRAINSAGHFNRMADEEGWSHEERSDPLLSSVLTLTRRGGIGTAVTLVSYSVLLLFLWFCISKSLALTEPCKTCETLLPNIATGRISNALMALALITVYITPLVIARKRSGTNLDR